MSCPIPVTQIISGIDSGGGLASRVIVLGGYGKNKLSTVELITASLGHGWSRGMK